MRSAWERGLKKWPYLVAVLAFVVSMGVALQYGMGHAWAGTQTALPAAEPAAAQLPGVARPGPEPPDAIDHAAPASASSLQAVLAAVAASTKSVGAVIWPLMILIALLVMLRLGAAIAGIGYDCGRSLLLITALAGPALLTALRLSETV
jgi:hypothetical protein